MKISVISILFCVSTLTWLARTDSAVEGPLLEAFEAIGKFAGVGDMVEEMTQTFKTFSQVSAFFKNDENIKHMTFIVSALEKSVQEGCSVWKSSQEVITGEGLKQYLEDVKKRVNGPTFRK